MTYIYAIDNRDCRGNEELWGIKVVPDPCKAWLNEEPVGCRELGYCLVVNTTVE